LDFPAPTGAPAGANGVPDGLRGPLKVLAGHISAARRLYRFGQFFRGFESFIKAVSDTTKPIPQMMKAVFLGFASFWTDVFDSLSYYQMVAAGDRTFADYWSAFFYLSQLAVGAWDQLWAFYTNLNRVTEVKAQLKALRSAGIPSPSSSPVVAPADPANKSNSTNGNSSPPEKKGPKTEVELKAELAALSWKRFEIVLDLIRRIGDGLTAMKALSVFFSDKNFTVAFGGAIGGLIGTWQTAQSIK